MNEREIDNALKQAAQVPHGVDPKVLEPIAASIKASIHPVRPLPPGWILATGLVLICAAVSLAGAAHSGFFGIVKMDWLQRGLIFPLLALLALFASSTFAGEMIPGSRRHVSPGAQLTVGVLALLVAFAALFRDHQVDHFIPVGLACLFTGLFYAFAAGLLCWLLLRRGFAVNTVSAGFVAGTLAGFAGVGMLELHCPNFQIAHLLVWHAGVVPVSAALGALAGWALRLRVRSTTQLKKTAH